MMVLGAMEMTGLAEVACRGNPDDLRVWLRGRGRPEAMEALLDLRQRALEWLHGDVARCRRVLDAVLPVLSGGDARLFPLFVAFLPVAAQVDETIADELFALSVDGAWNRKLVSLAAKCAVEWGQFCVARGRYDDAEEHFKRAQWFWNHEHRRSQAEELFVARAQALARKGNWRFAIDHIEGWIGECQSPVVCARLWLELSDAHARCGRPRRADDALRTAEDIYATRNDQFGIRLAEVYRARWFTALGAYDRAAELLAGAQHWLADRQHSSEADFARANMASLSIARESDLAEAAETLRDLLDHRCTRDPLVRWQILINLAAVLEKHGDYEEAIRLYRDLAAERPARDCDRKLADLNRLHLRIRCGVTDGVEDELLAALHDPVILGDGYLCFIAQENLGDLYRAAGQPAKATRSYAAAIDCMEESRLTLPWEFLRRHFQRSRLRVFDRLQQVLLDAGRCEEAWRIADRAKAQSLADFLGGSYPELEDLRRDEVRTLREELRQAYRAIVAVPPEPGNAGEIARLECLLDETLSGGRRVYDDTHASADWRDWPVLKRSEVALLDFVTVNSGWGVYVVRGGQVRFVRLVDGETAESLNRQIKAWWNGHARPMAGLSESCWQTETSTWHRQLIARVAEHLEGVRRLIVVPEGKLCLLPWAGLWDAENGFYLADRFDQGIAVLPGARAGQLLSCRQRHADTTLDLVVNPQANLLFNDFEAKRVRDHLGCKAQILSGTCVDEESLRTLLPRCRWLHFCGHGEFDVSRPMASHLKLSAGDRWTGWDMLSSPLPATTVVLSACEVGSAHAEAGGEWFGVLRGLLMSGASSVIASLWKVSDLACLAFMESFYGHQGARDGDLGIALRAAQLHVRGLGSWAREALAANCLEQLDWRVAISTSANPLLEIGDRSRAQQAIDLASTALNIWLAGPIGRLANDRQVLQQFKRQLEVMAQLVHPRWWAAFQLYGCHWSKEI